MMQQTNLVVVQAFALQSGANVTATPIDICDVCGGLFARPGSPLFFGIPHNH